MPAFNHTREDSALTPCPECAEQRYLIVEYDDNEYRAAAKHVRRVRKRRGIVINECGARKVVRKMLDTFMAPAVIMASSNGLMMVVDGVDDEQLGENPRFVRIYLDTLTFGRTRRRVPRPVAACISSARSKE